MKTILVDDELLSMADFQRECVNNRLINLVGVFDNPLKALEYARTNEVQFAILDIEMPGMDGLTLGARLRELYPQIILVFVTAYDKYASESIKFKADYYVLKPYTLEDVMDVLARAILLSGRQKKPFVMRTFGRFEMFVNGEPVYFQSAKAKELLAILVDRRGAYVSSEEALNVMWEDKELDDANLSMCRKAAMFLRKTLKEHGAEDILIEKSRGRRLDTTKFDCDYYALIDGDPGAKQLYMGEYMAQYAWAKNTAAKLSKMADMN